MLSHLIPSRILGQDVLRFTLLPPTLSAGSGHTLASLARGAALLEWPGEVPSISGSPLPAPPAVGPGKGCVHSD